MLDSIETFVNLLNGMFGKQFETIMLLIEFSVQSLLSTFSVFVMSRKFVFSPGATFLYKHFDELSNLPGIDYLHNF